MKNLSVLLILLLCIVLSSCQFPYKLYVKNNYENNLLIRFGYYLPKTGFGDTDSSIYIIPPDSLIIVKSSAFYFSSQINDIELRAIISLTSEGDTLSIDRYSTGFLEALNFKLNFPICNGVDSLEAKELREFKNSINALKYIKSQYYYNTNNYDSCIFSIYELLAEFKTLYGKSYSDFPDDATKDWYSVKKRGASILGFLSSMKLNKNDEAIKFVRILESEFSEYWIDTMIQDSEIRKFYNILNSKT